MLRTFRTAAVLAVVLGLAACGPPAEDTVVTPATPEPDTDTPEPDPTPDETPDPDDDNDAPDLAEQEVTAYFVRDDPNRVAVEPETHVLHTPTEGVARAAMELLVAGETRDPNLSTLAPADTEVLGVRVDGDVLIVDFSDAIRHGIGGTMGESALAAQLTHTGAQFDGVERVRVWVEGEPIDELWGHIDWSEPMEPPPHSLSPIIIDEPEWGDEVPAGPVTVSGTSLTFEANVVLRLYDPDGNLVEDTFTTAHQPDIDQRGPFEHTFETPADRAGTWRIEAVAPDMAGPDEGPGDFVTTVEFDVA
jgi:hypothetical protein